MKLVEFTSYPPAFEVVPAQVDGQLTIRFYTNVETVTRNNQGEETDSYIAECYEMNTRSSANLQDRIQANYDAWLEKAKSQDGGLDAIKQEKIKKSKLLLAEHLASHPLVSNAHNDSPGTYSVTEEKQTLMMSQYISYQAEKNINPDAVLTWNETGKSCEVWTEENFLKLVIEIKQYVYPLVSHQQRIEEQIDAASSIRELDEITIDYNEV